MSEFIGLLMFPALLVLIATGIPIAFSMLVVASAGASGIGASSAMPADATATMASPRIDFRGAATPSGAASRQRVPVGATAKPLAKSAPSGAGRDGTDAPPVIRKMPAPSPAGPIIIPGPDEGPVAPTRPSKPPRPTRPPGTCIGQICPVPIPYPN